MIEDNGRVPTAPGSREPSPSGLGPTGFDPSRKLTRSAAAERKRIIAVYVQAVGETGRAILTSGWNQFTPHQRRQQKAIAKAYELATDCLKRALEETNPAPELHIVSGKPLRDSDGSPEGGDACGSVHDSAGPSGDRPSPTPKGPQQ